MKLIYSILAVFIFNLSCFAQGRPEERKASLEKRKEELKVRIKAVQLAERERELDKMEAQLEKIEKQLEQLDEPKDSTRKKGGTFAISIGGGDEKKNDTSRKIFDFSIGVFDLGFNYLNDRTDYSSAAAQNFLNVSNEMKNENLFSLREGKSINVNIYPVVLKARILNLKKQRIYVSAGAGLQIYNFRFNKSVNYINETVPMVIMDSIAFTKNKLGVTYLSIPLMVTSKTKLAKNAWLVYGVGITGGYRLASWTKQVSGERGKQKNHDAFNFNNFNTCVTGEIGVDGWFRLYASYQLTALHKEGLEQYPYSIGIRFMGI